MIANFVFALLQFALMQPQPASAEVPPQAQTAQAQTAQAQTAQAQIAGECRQLQRLERIYSEADLGSPAIRDLPRAAIVTLAGEVNQPSAGWIRISSPAEGYILATFLAPCGSVGSQIAFPRVPLPPFPLQLPPVPTPTRPIAPPRFFIPPVSPLPPSSPPSQLRLPRSPSPPDRPEP